MREFLRRLPHVFNFWTIVPVETGDSGRVSTITAFVLGGADGFKLHTLFITNVAYKRDVLLGDSVRHSIIVKRYARRTVLLQVQHFFQIKLLYATRTRSLLGLRLSKVERTKAIMTVSESHSHEDYYTRFDND